MKQVYIVTGVCGHLGNTVANLLASEGKEVRGLALPGEDASMLNQTVEVFRGDVCERSSLELLFTGWSDFELKITMIHTAGIISIEGRDDRLIRKVNVEGTRNIIEICKEQKVDKLVYISSVHAIPELPQGTEITEVDRFSPEKVMGLYSKSKAAATALVLQAANEGLNVSIVHPSGLIGPNDYGTGLMTQMILNYLRGTLRACIKGGFDFVDVRDVAKAVISAAENGKNGSCYILSNQYYSIREIVDILFDLTGRKPIKAMLPLWFVKLFLPFTGLYFKALREKPLFTRESLMMLESNSNFSSEKAKKELGFKTIDMRQTLKDTVKFLQRIGRLKIKI